MGSTASFLVHGMVQSEVVVQVRAAISTRATNWQETRQPSAAARHHGYVPPRAVIVTTHPDNIAMPNKTTGIKASL